MIDLLKFEKPAQFPKDEILNDKDRMVRSWMSAEVRDRQGDIIPVNELKRVLNTWFKRGATMIDQHTNRPIGRGLRWQEGKHPKGNVPGLILDYQVFDDYTVDDQVWDEIKQGKRTGLSIGGRATGVPEIKYDQETGESGKQLSGLELYEVSPVDRPANQLSETIAVNYFAKGDIKEDPVEFEKKLMEDLKKGYEGDPTKAFGGFEGMDSCMAGQKERGHSEESAQRICTFLQHRTNTQFQKGTLENKETTPRVAVKEDNIPGGLADGKDPKSVDQEQLAMGIKVEQEHTKDPAKAREIAMDHLQEDPKYYTHLNEMENEYKALKKSEATKNWVQKPFADYKNFDACVAANSDKSNPAAYCAQIHHNATSKWPSEKQKEMDSDTAFDEGYKAGKESCKEWPADFLKDLQNISISKSSGAQKDTQPEKKSAREDASAKKNEQATSKSLEKSAKTQVGWPEDFVKALSRPTKRIGSSATNINKTNGGKNHGK